MTVNAAPVTTPATPTNLARTLYASRSVRVTWTDVAGENSYELERCRSTTTTPCTSWGSLLTLGANTVTRNVILSQNGYYRWRLRACNASSQCSPYAETTALWVP